MFMKLPGLDLDALVSSLNPRGVREGELLDRIIAEREVLERRLGKRCQTRAWLVKEEEDLAEDALPLGTSLRDVVELALRLASLLI